MDLDLKTQIADHVSLCEKIMERHLDELKKFYIEEIEPIESAFRKQVDTELEDLLDVIKEAIASEESDDDEY